MSSIPETPLPPSADQLADIADQGKSISRFFTNNGTMVHPAKVQRIHLDVPEPMLQEPDRAAHELDVSRQSIIKSLLRQSLDQHYLAASNRPR